jgi:hypoxanthine phosphoribosyltransferase
MYELGETLISRERIREMVLDVAARLNRDYAGRELVVIGVLKGAIMFLTDLCRELDMPVTIDFIVVSSYGAQTKSSGVVLLVKDVDSDIKDKHVLVVEDLIDTGVTLSYLKGLFLSRGPASLKICTAFDKPERRKTDLVPEYVGLRLPDEFVVGYGLDYANRYRNLPDLRVLTGSEP